jgi:uncharacterized membrane protein YoaK (UPF0700 family)
VDPVSAAKASDAAGAAVRPAAPPPARVMTLIAILLTFASGASDVASFTRLGNVFTSVMTGNMIVFGLSLARGSVSLAAHTAVAVGAYVMGVAIGARLAWHHSRRRRPAAEQAAPGGDWPPYMTLTLLVEVTLFAGVVAGWELTGSKPAGAAQFLILVGAASAMGIQSAAVNRMGLGNVSTTYLTGTMTGLVSAIARPDGKRVGVRAPSVLVALTIGAVLAGLLLANAAALVPLLPLTAVTAAMLLGSGAVRPAWLAPSPPSDAPHVSDAPYVPGAPRTSQAAPHVPDAPPG